MSLKGLILFGGKINTPVHGQCLQMHLCSDYNGQWGNHEDEVVIRGKATHTKSGTTMGCGHRQHVARILWQLA